MLLVAYLDYKGRKISVLGLPGCVMYAKRTVFDLILPRVMADDEIKAEEIAGLGEGGLCLNCPVCTFPTAGLENNMNKFRIKNMRFIQRRSRVRMELGLF